MRADETERDWKRRCFNERQLAQARYVLGTGPAHRSGVGTAGECGWGGGSGCLSDGTMAARHADWPAASTASWTCELGVGAEEIVRPATSACTSPPRPAAKRNPQPSQVPTGTRASTRRFACARPRPRAAGLTSHNGHEAAQREAAWQCRAADWTRRCVSAGGPAAVWPVAACQISPRHVGRASRLFCFFGSGSGSVYTPIGGVRQASRKLARRLFLSPGARAATGPSAAAVEMTVQFSSHRWFFSLASGLGSTGVRWTPGTGHLW